MTKVYLKRIFYVPVHSAYYDTKVYMIFYCLFCQKPNFSKNSHQRFHEFLLEVMSKTKPKKLTSRCWDFFSLFQLFKLTLFLMLCISRDF